jgi:hypothetical protein
MDCPDVFGELLIVFNCSVLSFWIGNKDLSWTEPPVRYTILTYLRLCLQSHLWSELQKTAK